MQHVDTTRALAAGLYLSAGRNYTVSQKMLLGVLNDEFIVGFSPTMAAFVITYA